MRVTSNWNKFRKNLTLLATNEKKNFIPSCFPKIFDVHCWRKRGFRHDARRRLDRRCTADGVMAKTPDYFDEHRRRELQLVIPCVTRALVPMNLNLYCSSLLYFLPHFRAGTASSTSVGLRHEKIYTGAGSSTF